ncbi:MAG: excalibur calcium-binding domain-containing protein [Methylobacter sp.]
MKKILLIAIVIAAFIYSKVSKVKTFFDQADILKVEALLEKPREQFQCQGKVWCSEMSSYEEALLYLRNCPDTKMDGDSDGIPCEQQFQ